MNMYTKYKRPTEKNYGHTEVYVDEKCVGYLIPNHSTFAVVGENYNFVGNELFKHDNFHATSRQAVLDKLKVILQEQTS